LFPLRDSNKVTPDDNQYGGWYEFEFDEPTAVRQITLVDIGLSDYVSIMWRDASDAWGQSGFYGGGNNVPVTLDLSKLPNNLVEFRVSFPAGGAIVDMDLYLPHVCVPARTRAPTRAPTPAPTEPFCGDYVNGNECKYHSEKEDPWVLYSTKGCDPKQWDNTNRNGCPEWGISFLRRYYNKAQNTTTFSYVVDKYAQGSKKKDKIEEVKISWRGKCCVYGSSFFKGEGKEADKVDSDTCNTGLRFDEEIKTESYGNVYSIKFFGDVPRAEDAGRVTIKGKDVNDNKQYCWYYLPGADCSTACTFYNQ
jgi:hypothetical protein